MTLSEYQAEREKQLTTGRANEHLNDAATCYEIIAKLRVHACRKLT